MSQNTDYLQDKSSKQGTKRKSSRHSSHSRSNKRSKSNESVLPFTTTEFLTEKIKPDDKFVSVVGYVNTLNKIKSFKSKDSKNLEIFKFILDNNDGRKLSCYAWNEDATKFHNKIKLHQILLIQNAVAKPVSNFNHGNLPYELQLKQYTKINVLGDFNALKHDTKILKIANLEDICDKHGYIETEGYLRDEFFVPNKSTPEMLSGSITDGQSRIEIILTCVDQNFSIKQGQRIQITGEIREHAYNVKESPEGSSSSFVCVDGSEILLSHVCDGIPDCQDVSDETQKLCRHVVCPISMFRCAYGACIPRKSRCNGIQNCADGSDEVRCDVADICTDREFQCVTISDCIPLRDLCNGYVDCRDGSDENATTCQGHPCPPHTYHCSYGGCVHQEVICDGAKDCIDGTDEDPVTCAAMHCQGSECENYKCSSEEFSCDSGGQCVPNKKVCDGIHQCRDGSDENSILCSKSSCPSGSFRCSYGGCIPANKKCNFEQNCHDWSDEDESICGVSLPEGACRLPSAKPDTHYSVLGCPDCRPGEVVAELTKLDYLCDIKGSIEGSSTIYCEDNKWIPSVPTCPTNISRITCPPLTANGAIKRCEVKWGPREGWISCDSSVPVGTHAFLECPTYYESESGASHTTCLHDGTWSRKPLNCKPACGDRGLSALPLIVNGWEASRSDPLPWHAALFSYENGKLSFFCGGTLLGEQLVLTAGHCVWKSDADLLKIVLGGYSSDFNSQGEDTQVFGVKKIELQYSYQDHEGNYGSDLAVLVLDKPATINSMVRPACIDWKNANDVVQRNGDVGLVSGMGITENDTFSSTLRVTSVQIVSDDKCREKQKKDFRKYITYTSFCGGWGNGTGVCNGDSGGGLVLLRPNSTVWEVHGVVSISPRRLGTSFCDPKFYTVFTKVSAYATWIKEFLDNIPVVGPPNSSSLPNHDTIG